MNVATAKQIGFTHHATMYGINGYVKIEDDYGMEFRAKWLLTDYIHEALVYLDSFIGFNEQGFKVNLGAEL